ncbi:hypothetical protein HZS38_17940 [Xenorhabdus nematophila]|uniref:hypothetical protein n=1 Tax=Xenorhabdus nematophila TaxID=628 RepID=UPI0003275CDE|nr:hypothetical protein [Xenorhabdus nematophila]CEE92712.1 conserved hypothetical protein [Xenorhabdus nematophila str. Anatoliense]CEF32609.1 conserved hypothetical protein [Xenorhabdus nematophila str. Websteri]AYA42196.1 hypothetical protein D3790_18655 [Xenorhabdus nematophila]KHD28957.1 hypothetical protein LH67_06765 [Xenorhabdus nematophila]MBA0020922.1 hypothetical protein [Xenorhabdus nematophila]
MTDIKIPFSYCKLSRAANFLKCEVSDLINMAAMNKIEALIMLDGFHARVNFIGNIEDAKKWYKTLSYPSKVSILSMQTRKITDYSYLEFDNKDYLGENKTGVDIFTEKSGDNNIVGYAYAYGLWRVSFVNRLEFKGSEHDVFPVFSPCLMGGKSPIQGLFHAHPFLSFEKENRVDITSSTFNLSHEDLWITSYDIRRILENDCDCDSINEVDSINIIENKMIDKINIRSEKAIERHSKNKLDVFRAAIIFKEEDIELFNEKCRHKDGRYNFSEWARQIKKRENRLFPDCKAPVSDEKMAEYISKALKPPHS